jgi:hypothetical protein
MLFNQPTPLLKIYGNVRHVMLKICCGSCFFWRKKGTLNFFSHIILYSVQRSVCGVKKVDDDRYDLQMAAKGKKIKPEQLMHFFSG